MYRCTNSLVLLCMLSAHSRSSESTERKWLIPRQQYWARCWGLSPDPLQGQPVVITVSPAPAFLSVGSELCKLSRGPGHWCMPTDQSPAFGGVDCEWCTCGGWGRMWDIILCDSPLGCSETEALCTGGLQSPLGWLLGELLGDTCLSHRPSQLWLLT